MNAAVRDVPPPRDLGGLVETPTEASLRKQRWAMIGVACTIFTVLNLVVIAIIWHQLSIENAALKAKTLLPTDRIVTSNVLISIIGATVIETGFAVRTIVKSLFG